MNVTTLLVPLFTTVRCWRARIIPRSWPMWTSAIARPSSCRVALRGRHRGAGSASGRSTARGTGLANLGEIASFGAAYMTVVLVEPLVDLGVLAGAKAGAGCRARPSSNAACTPAP